MRRVFCVVCCLLMLTACTKTPIQPIVSGFRCQVDMTYDGEAYSGTLDRSDERSAVLTISEPDAVSGLTMTWDGETVSLSYLGMELALENSALPVGTVVKVICETLDACVANVEGGTVPSTVEGESACGHYTLSFDENSGMPICLAIPSLSLEINFSAWEKADAA